MPTLLAASQWRRSSVSAKPGKRRRRVQPEVLEVLGFAGLEVLPMGRLLDRDHALEQVGSRDRGGHEAQGRLGMGIGVVGDRVALHHFAAGDLRQVLGIAPDVEERGAYALVGERLEDLRRRRLSGPVVESEDHLMVGEGDGSRIGLQPNLQAALCADRDDARGSKLLGPASLSPCNPRAGEERRERDRNPH